jgi:hypothetical protein
MLFIQRFKSASFAASLHFLGCIAVAGFAAALVFGLWYPYPYRLLAGGWDLFWLVIGVDVACGPLLTLVLFDRRKKRSELLRDLGLIAFIQTMALCYGLWSVAIARPVYLVFEADRFHIVSAAEIDSSTLLDAQGDLQRLPYTGPKIIAARVPKTGDTDYLASIDMSLAGFSPALRAGSWRNYSSYKDAVIAKAQPINRLKAKHPKYVNDIDTLVAKTKLTVSSVGYIPVQGRHAVSWVALVNVNDANVVGFLPLDGL